MIEEDYALQGRRSLRRLQLTVRHLREHFGDDRAARITADRLVATPTLAVPRALR